MSDRPAPSPTTTHPVLVRAVIPCHAVSSDLDRIIGDLSRSDSDTDDRAGIRLEALVIDNGASPALNVPATPGVRVRTIRLESNQGGSGGFNAGMMAALDDLAADFVWLLDSDARVEPSTLPRLVETLRRHPDAWAAGPSIAEDASGTPHEIGGRVDRRRGTLGPAFVAGNAPSVPTEVDYVASCCLLARAAVVRAHGLRPDVFLTADDAQWCLTISRRSGRRVLVNPAARAFHPSFHRPATWQRFYQARNAFGPLAALGLPRRVVFRRAMVEVCRAVNQGLIGREDLAGLHMNGLAAAASGDRTGRGPDPLTRVEPTRPIEELRANRPTESPDGSSPDKPSPGRSLVSRLVFGPTREWAEVDLKGGREAWVAARNVIVREGDRGVLVRTRWPWVMLSAGSILLRGMWLACRLFLSPPGEHPLASASSQEHAPDQDRVGSPPLPSLSIIVLSYNRRDDLRRTLADLAAGPATAGLEVIVVDNASTDGSAGMVVGEFPGVRLLALRQNIGVGGFNRGVAESSGDMVLVLDDDARPDPGSLDAARRWLADHPRGGAVALLPRHPVSGQSEWPFATSATCRAGSCRVDSRWPVMGSGNLVRRKAWDAVGGYEERFFLYRNDTDLAMKLLASGREVAFCSSWIVWHDSPAARSKSRMWCRLATRNWVYLARRHGRGFMKIFGGAAGWAWAHRLAGFRPGCQWAALAGAIEGLFTAPPPLPEGVIPDGTAFDRLVRLQVRPSSAGRSAPPASPSIVRPTPRTTADGPAPMEGESPPGTDTTVGASAAISANTASMARHSA
ncbi:MAG: glycosyltransferase [Phycisphaerae bacterium]|nr:glycosyltransferase [Phycisphaerae bacterium]